MAIAGKPTRPGNSSTTESTDSNVEARSEATTVESQESLGSDDSPSPDGGPQKPPQEKPDKEIDKTDEISERHKTSLEQFKEGLGEAARHILAKRKRYERVVAIIVYWENAKNLKHMEKNAKQLCRLFEKKYGFEVTEYVISETCDVMDFTADLIPKIRQVKADEKSLLIMYYGGHADVSKDRECLWMAENKPSSPKLEWSVAQVTLFKGTQCDKLFLLDCCYAGDMVDRKIPWKGACELLGAASGAATASAKQNSSFTAALIEVLNDTGLDIRHIWSLFTDSRKRSDYGLEVDPFYWDYTGSQHPPISLRAMNQNDPGITKAGRGVSDARILIKVIFEGEASVVMAQWRSFLSSSPKDVSAYEFDVCREASLVTLFQSNSCTAIFALPVWLWAGMVPTARGYDFLGVIRSENLVGPESRHFKSLSTRRPLLDISTEILSSGALPTSTSTMEPAPHFPSPLTTPSVPSKPATPIALFPTTPVLPSKPMKPKISSPSHSSTPALNIVPKPEKPKLDKEKIIANKIKRYGLRLDDLGTKLGIHFHAPVNVLPVPISNYDWSPTSTSRRRIKA